MDSIFWLVKQKMCERKIETLQELSKLTGIGYQTLRQKIHHPDQLRIYEITAINEVLQFSDGELLRIMKGE